MLLRTWAWLKATWASPMDWVEPFGRTLARMSQMASPLSTASSTSPLKPSRAWPWLMSKGLPKDSRLLWLAARPFLSRRAA